MPIAATISSKDFSKEYLNDNKSANVKFAGKLIRLKGKIKEVVTDKNPRIVLESTEDAKWTVECLFAHPSELAGVSADQEVLIMGECELRADSDKNVQLFCCKLARL